MMATDKREMRLQILLSEEDRAALESFRFKQQMPSLAAAVRKLIRLGIASDAKIPSEPPG